MALTQKNYTDLIVTELNATGNPAIGVALPTLWTIYQDKAVFGQRMQYLHVKRACIDILLGALAGQIDIDIGGDQLKQTDESDNLHRMREDIDGEIARIYKRTRANRTIYAGPLTTTEPATVLPGAADPNDSVYKGDPQKRITYRP